MEADARFSLLQLPSGELRQLDAAALAALGAPAAGRDSLAWLDLADPQPADLEALSGSIGLHPLALEDMQRRGQRPKVDTYANQYVIVAYEVLDPDGGATADEFRLGEMHLVVRPGLLVSVHWGPSPAVADVRRRLPRRADVESRLAGRVLYELLDSVTDAYFPLLDRIGERIDDLQDRIVGGTDASASLRDVLRLKRRLLDLRRAVAPLRDVANTLLRREAELVDEATVPYYQDLYDHLVRVLDNLDLYREMIAASLDANLSVTSNQLNVVVKRLTAFTVLLMLPTLIAGIYGMNFRFMPELSWPFGYAFALVLMAGAMAGAYAFFRARDWF